MSQNIQHFQSFQWMSRVLQAVDSIHQVGIYCLALVPPNHLPKTPLGGIHLSETRKKFLEGSLHPANVLMCPHTCVTNLPKPREVHHGKHLLLPLVGHLVTLIFLFCFYFILLHCLWVCASIIGNFVTFRCGAGQCDGRQPSAGKSSGQRTGPRIRPHGQ